MILAAVGFLLVLAGLAGMGWNAKQAVDRDAMVAVDFYLRVFGFLALAFVGVACLGIAGCENQPAAPPPASRVEPCRMVWSDAVGDSVLYCPDPFPPSGTPR